MGGWSGLVAFAAEWKVGRRIKPWAGRTQVYLEGGNGEIVNKGSIGEAGQVYGVMLEVVQVCCLNHFSTWVESLNRILAE